MTTITIVDAAILAHLSKQPKENVRTELTSRLSLEARQIAPLLINTKFIPKN
jgi:hypothetical protein